MKKMQQIITKSLQDMLSKDVILFVIKIGFISFALTLLFAWSMWGLVTNIIASYLSWTPWEWVQTSCASVSAFFFTYMLF